MVRAFAGRRDPTPRQGSDGEWRQYQEISDIVIGQPVMIVWRFVNGVMETTCLSSVQSIEQCH